MFGNVLFYIKKNYFLDFNFEPVSNLSGFPNCQCTALLSVKHGGRNASLLTKIMYINYLFTWYSEEASQCVKLATGTLRF